MRKENIPCCAAEALRQIRPVSINGTTVGLAMLERIFAEVKALECTGPAEVKAELLNKVKVYNYVPQAASEVYTEAIYSEYLKEMNKKW